MKKKIFSGIQPTGQLHLGNYLGAIRNWVKLQADFDNIFCVVDLHAITVAQDPDQLKENVKNTLVLLLAAGIDPQKSSLFVQSQIKEHTELTWLLNCLTPMGWLNRMTQFKEKSGVNKEKASIGLYDYPILMAADILLYQTDFVPVGEDQKQHVELARDIAKKFNNSYGQTFVIPEAMISESGARIMGLQDPTKKMSKSGPSQDNLIYLLDEPAKIKKKIMAAVTDSENKVVFDPQRPGLNNLLTIYQKITDLSQSQIEAEFSQAGYGQFKQKLVEVILKELEPLQQKYHQIKSTQLDSILEKSLLKLKPQAEKTITVVKQKMGL